MDKRAARRYATRLLAYSANQLCAELGARTVLFSELPYVDRQRVLRAMQALKHELDVRTGDAARAPKPEPVDSMQETLFTLEGNNGQEAVAQAADRQGPDAE